MSATIRPCANFNPTADAQLLRKAMKGLGTDEIAIINVLTKRTREQRQEIALQFKTLFGRDLIKDLHSELSGNFRKTILSLMPTLPQYYAQELHDAIAGWGTKEHTLIDILCTLSNQEMRSTKEEYQALYNKSLEDDIIRDTSGHFQRLLISLCCANRDESQQVNIHRAREDAQKLYAAGEQRLGTDESVFNAIMVQNNYTQLQLIFREYYKLTGNDIERAIAKEFSGDIKNGLLAIAKYAKNKATFFAERLYESMKGLGTDDTSLVRIIVSRSEIDLLDIREEFFNLYQQSLEDWITDDTSGDYKKCLLAIVNPTITY